MIASVSTPEPSFAYLPILQLFAFGINHHTAPLDVREQVSIEAVRLDEALHDLVF